MSATPQDVFKQRDIRAGDGSSLRVFECGRPDGEPVVLVNAYGMPVEFVRPLAEDLLAYQYRVLTWESRGVPNLEAGFTRENCTVTDHARDMNDVMNEAGMPKASVVGWCSGAQVALRFNAMHSDRIRRLVLLSGVYSFRVGGIFSEFQSKLNQILPPCASSLETADTVSKIIVSQLGGQPSASESEAQLASVIGAIPAEVLPLTSGAFASGERLFRYANMEAGLLTGPDHGWAAQIAAETLVITGDADPLTAPENSREVVRRAPSAKLRVVPGGDHYMHYLRPDVRVEIRDFLEKGARRDVVRVAESIAG